VRRVQPNGRQETRMNKAQLKCQELVGVSGEGAAIPSPPVKVFGECCKFSLVIYRSSCILAVGNLFSEKAEAHPCPSLSLPLVA